MSKTPERESVLFFASVQSPYCYFALDRLARIDRELAPVDLRLVAPGVLRLAQVFRGRPAEEQAYFLHDVARTAAFLGLPYAEARPYPVAMRSGTLYEATEEQPRVALLHRLIHRASRQGRAMAAYTRAMALIWDGATPGWDKSAAFRALQADYDAAGAPDAAEQAEIAAWLAENHAALRAGGHWGVPSFLHAGEIFYGQDRIDQLIWRLGRRGA